VARDLQQGMVRPQPTKKVGWGRVVVGLLGAAYFVGIFVLALGCPQLLERPGALLYLGTGLLASATLVITGRAKVRATPLATIAAQVSAGLIAGYLALPSSGAIVALLALAHGVYAVRNAEGMRISAAVALAAGLAVGAVFTLGTTLDVSGGISCP